jgi:hypothetical protein
VTGIDVNNYPAVEFDQPAFVDFVNNHYIRGPSGGMVGIALLGAGNDWRRALHPASRIHIRGNLLPDLSRYSNRWLKTASKIGGDWTDVVVTAGSSSPYFSSPLRVHRDGVEVEPVETLLNRLIRQGDVGAVLPRRDSVDERILQEVMRRGGSIIDSQEQVGGWPKHRSSVAPPADRDGDGMPDLWEERNGFSPRDSSDGSGDQDEDGFTNVEEYLNRTKPRVPE